MTMEGIIKTTMMKFTGTMMAAKIPKARIGRISLEALARKAKHVVLEVTVIARKERLNAYAILLFSSLATKSIRPPCRQASQ